MAVADSTSSPRTFNRGQLILSMVFLAIGFASVAWTRLNIAIILPEVMTGIGMDSRIGAKFLNAGLGWGGSCSGKDIQALVHTARESFVPDTAIAERIRDQLAKVGVQVEIDARADFGLEIARRAHDLYLKRLGADYAHPNTFFTLFERGGNHQTGWETYRGGEPLARFERLLEEADAEADEQRARTLYAQAQALPQLPRQGDAVGCRRRRQAGQRAVPLLEPPARQEAHGQRG